MEEIYKDRERFQSGDASGRETVSSRERREMVSSRGRREMASSREKRDGVVEGGRERENRHQGRSHSERWISSVP